MTIIYVVKGCLARGAVIKVDATNIYGSNYRFKFGRECYTHVYAGDYCFNEEDALSRAIQMRDKRIASLKKQIAKLESYTFGGACE